jgi:hypothetical protein
MFMHKVRNYEVKERSPEVQERIMRALGERATASLNAQLTDVYEGDLPIPAEIEDREVTFTVMSVSRSRKDSLRAYGLTPDKAGVTVTIPKDIAEQSTLSLVDAARPKNRRRRLAKS